MLHAEGSLRANTLPYVPSQPQPINVQIVHSERDGRVETAIARSWRIEDARRCRLCDRCTATVAVTESTALCLKVHRGHVPDAEAALFRDTVGPVGLRDDQRHRAMPG